MVDKSQSLTQRTPHNKHHCQTNNSIFTVINSHCIAYSVLATDDDHRVWSKCLAQLENIKLASVCQIIASIT